MTIMLVEGDTKPVLNFTVTDSTGAAVNLTGATVTFHFYNKADDTQTNVGDDDVVLVVAADGTCKYTFNATDLADPGDYWGELKIVFSDTTIQTVYEKLDIRVRKALG